MENKECLNLWAATVVSQARENKKNCTVGEIALIETIEKAAVALEIYTN